MWLCPAQGTFGREPQAKPEDDRYLRAAIQEYDNIAKLGQIMREGPIKVRHLHVTSSRQAHAHTRPHPIQDASFSVVMYSLLHKIHWGTRSESGT